MHTDSFDNSLLYYYYLGLPQAMHSVAEHPEHELLTKYA